MNIANVTAKFAAFSGVDGDELFRQSALIDSAVNYIERRAKTENPTSEQTDRLELLSAAYAYKLYDFCNDADITSFTAGDVSISSPGGGKGGGEKLWQEMLRANADLISGDEFIFGRM